MLKHLSIKNYALIEALNISPSECLNIVTGETGAGKSIMLGAAGLLLGNRADTKTVLHEQQKCVIEGTFDLSDYDLEPLFEAEDLDYETLTVIRREITPAGKSRAFVNDTPVTLEVLKKLGMRLMDVHSQHDTLQIAGSDFQLGFVDAYAGALTLRHDYAAEFKSYKNTLKALQKLQSENEQASKEADYHTFLLGELTNTALQEGEQEELEKAVKLTEHAEEVKTRLHDSFRLLDSDDYSVATGLQNVRQSLSPLSRFGEPYTTLGERIESVLIELNDISAEIEKQEEDVSFDPDYARQVQERLGEIYRLQQKHGVADIAALLRIQEELTEKVARSQNLEEEIAEASAKVKHRFDRCTALADELSAVRKSSFGKLESELTALLGEVGMADARIHFDHTTVPIGSAGSDEIKILFSANKGVAPQELSRVASGGEFSRLMFCIKYILTAQVALPTVIFDEIDTGISGEVAIKMGLMMQKMARQHQVIAISHLPQIAAKGDKHYYVYKDNTLVRAISRIKELEGDERTLAIAKMLGGDHPSEVAFENARELIAE